MGDPPRSPTTDSYSILGISKTASIKDVCKAYKSLVMKWHPDKNPSNKSEAQTKFTQINEAYKAVSGEKQEETTTNRSSDDNFFSIPSFLMKSASRRSTTPTPLSRNMSRKNTTTLTDNLHATATPILSKSMSRKTTDHDECHSPLSRNMSRRSTTPIIYSQSTARRKPPPIEEKLQCTLEELCHGTVKKIKITRNVITDAGRIAQEEEILKIKIKAGWKKGTKITFEGKGDEKPGNLPADIIFVIDEKRHHLFKREGDDLEIGVEIPLVQALTGCSLRIPLLGSEETMHLHIDDIIHPGSEKIIQGQGMPKPKDEGKRGDLRIRFLVNFPEDLSDEQRSDAVSILRDSS